MSNYSDQIRNAGLTETYWDNYADEQEAKLQKQKEALFPRELLEPAYHDFVRMRGAGANPSAYEFFNFLLRQCKQDHYGQSKTSK